MHKGLLFHQGSLSFWGWYLQRKLLPRGETCASETPCFGGLQKSSKYMGQMGRQTYRWQPDQSLLQRIFPFPFQVCCNHLNKKVFSLRLQEKCKSGGFWLQRWAVELWRTVSQRNGTHLQRKLLGRIPFKDEGSGAGAPGDEDYRELHEHKQAH